MIREHCTYDRDGKSNNEDPGDCAHSSDHFAESRSWSNVSVAHRGHRDQRPPEARRDGGEARASILLAEVAQTGVTRGYITL